MLYSTLKILEEWESILTRRLDALGEPPDDLFGDEDDYESVRFPALMRQKLLLEPGNSPFRYMYSYVFVCMYLGVYCICVHVCVYTCL